MLTRGELKGQILRLLNKSADYTGFYEDDNINDAIQESYDFVSVEMFEANEGWLTKIQYFTTSANQLTREIPHNVQMIREVRYKVGNTYVPLTYDDGTDSESNGEDSSAGTQRASTYRIVDNALYFDPPLAEGGTNFLQIESTNYPAWLMDDQDRVNAHFSRACMHFMKYKSASILAANLEKPFRPWAAEQNSWYSKMKTTITKRVNKPTRIREFGG